MKFPIEVDLALSVKKSPNLTIEIAAEKLRRGLKRHKVADLSENDNIFEFRGGMFRMTTNWNLFYPVSRSKVALDETNEEIKIQAVLYYTGASFTHAFFQLGIILLNVMILKENGLNLWPINLFLTAAGIMVPIINFSISKARIRRFFEEVLL